MINSPPRRCTTDQTDEHKFKFTAINGTLLNHIELAKIKDEIMITMS